MIHTVKGFSVVDETEVDVFLKFPCFLYDPANVGNLMSGSSAFSKPSLDIWKFLVCIFLRPSIQDFKDDLTSVDCCSVAQSCLTLCNPMDYSRLVLFFPVLHHLPELAQTHIHWVSHAIQPSHPLSSAFPPAFNLSFNKSLFQWVSFSHQVAKVLELLHQSFQWIFRVDFLLGLTGLISLQSKGLSRVFSSTTIQKYQFFGTQPSLWSNFLIRYWKNHSFDYMNFSQQSNVSIS